MKKPPITKVYHLSLRRPYDTSDTVEMTLYLFIFISGTVGNGVVIRSFLQARDQPGSRFVVSLAFIDLISSIWVPMMNIILVIYEYKHWPLGEIACLMSSFTQSTFYASAWFLVAISLERAR